MEKFKVDFGANLPRRQFNHEKQVEETVTETLAENFLAARRHIWSFIEVERQRTLLEKAEKGGVQELTREEFDVLYEHLKHLNTEQKKAVIASFEKTGIDIFEYEKSKL